MTGKRSIDVDEDRRFQERFWSFQRVAWVAMALLVLAALAGATGKGGPLSHAKATGAGGEIDYPRVARWQATDQMMLTLPPEASGSVTVELDDRFSRIFSIEDIEPQPERSAAIAGGHRFEFLLGDGAGDKSIIFHLRADQPSLATQIDARVGESAPMRLWITVLP